MTERDLLIVLNERTSRMTESFSDYVKRLDQLETDFIKFKTEIDTRFKMYTAAATAIATAVGSVITQLLQVYFQK